ncbi:MAG: hypothetical protein EZS28_009956 [Streblomastix strix]|uniref:Uncharacterized protein n=1 Tax=Streblomastix strix TaxID=222440 RepID=A0A5J4WHH5_9EUKA|nr:MAG: hypothetical protein EZS28_009956 [Streblomastix strix]
METTIETNNDVQSEQVEQQIEKRSVGRPKKYFNDDDRKEAILQLNEDISTCCTRFMNDGTIILTEIRIGNVNIHALDENKVNLLRDTYKLCLQKVKKITSILDLSQISSKVMQAVSQGLLTVLNKI